MFENVEGCPSNRVIAHRLDSATAAGYDALIQEANVTLDAAATRSQVLDTANPALTAALAIAVISAATLAGAWFFKHESMGPLWLLGYAVPSLCLALVAGAASSRRLPDGPRRATMAARATTATTMNAAT